MAKPTTTTGSTGTAPAAPQGNSNRAVRTFMAPAPIIPKTVQELFALAEIFYKAGMHPKGITRPEGVAAVIAFGLEIGIRPAAALNNIYFASKDGTGKAQLWGDMPLALVQASGLLEQHKEWIDGAGEQRTAHCVLQRKGDPEGPKDFTYSVGQARQMGLFNKMKDPGPWDKDPDWMLKLRARGRGLREKFADVLLGMGIAETEDESPTTQTTQPATPVQVTTVSTDSTTTTGTTSPPTDEHGELMIDEAQLREVVRLQPVWVKLNGPSSGTPADGIAAWKSFLKTRWNVESAKSLTGSQADDLIAILRETEKTPTAALFAPSPANGAQQPNGTQQQPTPMTAAA